MYFISIDWTPWAAAGTGTLSPVRGGGQKVIGKTVAILLLTAAAANAAQEAKEAEINLKHPDTFTVYFLADETGRIRYVGRTKNLKQRLCQHEKSGGRTANYEYAFSISNLAYTQARGLEEIGIIFYGTLNSTGNLIRGISENNLNCDIYFESALDVIYNRELNIILNAGEGFN